MNIAVVFLQINATKCFCMQVLLEPNGKGSFSNTFFSSVSKHSRMKGFIETKMEN